MRKLNWLQINESLQRKNLFRPVMRGKQRAAQPNRGEVWSVDLGLAAKDRPCLVLSVPYEEEEWALVTTIAHTTSPRLSRFEVSVKTRFLRRGVFDAQNIVTLPRAKLLTKLGSLTSLQTATVETAVPLRLGL